MNILQSIIHNECFALQRQASNWQEAIFFGCELLEKKEFVTKSYYTGILESTHEYGPYYVFAPYIAMPHARPEDGVLQTGFSLVTLQEGVAFGSRHDPVDTILTFAAKEKKEMNEEVIVQMMELMENEQVLRKIRECPDGETLKTVVVDMERSNNE